jgi:hypothetical protein
MMPLAVDTAAALQKEADLLAASQGKAKLLGYVTSAPATSAGP